MNPEVEISKLPSVRSRSYWSLNTLQRFSCLSSFPLPWQLLHFQIFENTFDRDPELRMVLQFLEVAYMHFLLVAACPQLDYISGSTFGFEIVVSACNSLQAS